jgi:polyvinyl alcohol dehydrogenase (cytochrome)
MSPRAILAALTQGSMRAIATEIPDSDRRAVAEYLSRRSLTDTPFPPSAHCRVPPGRTPPETAADWTAWGGSPRGTGFRTEEQAGLSAADIPQLELRWAFGFPGGTLTRSQPSVVGGQLLVGSQFGEVYSLDAETGCIHWIYRGDAAVKGVVAISPPDAGGRRLAVAADFTGRVVALDIETGEPRWAVEVADHPASNVTGSPVIDGRRVYVPLSSMEVVMAMNPTYRCCTSSGGVVALDLDSGAILWRHRVIAEEAEEVGRTAGGRAILGPAGAPVWSSPTVDRARGLLYIGTGENYTHPTTETSDAIVALELETGKVAWRFQATAKDAFNMACTTGANRDSCPTPNGHDVDFGQAPLIARLSGGRELLVVGQKLGMVYALDPDRGGALVWKARVGRGGALGGVHWGLAVAGDRVFVPISDRVTGLDPEGERRPGLHALDLATGQPVWSQTAPSCAGRLGCFAAYSAAPVAIEGAVLAGGLDGQLRGYAAADGQVVWSFDTVREFTTVNGVAAKGGAIDGPAPTVAGGMVYLSAGYGLFGQLPGNVLLAFGVRRR